MSVLLVPANAADETYLNRYPMIFVHGLNGWGGGEGINDIVPYWGATTGNLITYLRDNNYECYSASVGPVSSAWDRACELYAQLTGTTVDYGEAHSKAHNHLRYGRTYDEPLFEGWGDSDVDGNIKKIHLIGHSFGGTTIRMMTYLMTYGCEEEIAESGNDVSPLFTGGKENWIESVSTICTPHNSSTSYYFTRDFYLYDPVQFLSAVYAGVMGRSLFNGFTVDFHLEQFGLTNIPGENNADELISALKRYLDNSDDTCQYDLTPEGAEKINNMLEISPNIYYFSYAFDATRKSELTGMVWPEAKYNPVIAPVGCYIAHHKDFIDETTGQVYDENWKANDLLCNTISETYPFDEPFRTYDGNAEKGVWNVMPEQRGDHGTAIGLLGNKEEVHKFYIELCEILNKLK